MVVQREVQASSCLCSLLILPSAVSFQRRSRNAPRIITHGAAALFAQENCGSLITPRAPALSCHVQHWQPRSVLPRQSRFPASCASKVFGFAVSQALNTGQQLSLLFYAVTSGKMEVFWWAAAGPWSHTDPPSSAHPTQGLLGCQQTLELVLLCQDAISYSPS